MNRSCPCESVGAEELAAFYSNAPVFIGADHLREIRALISSVHRVVALPAFTDVVLTGAPTVARREQRALGVFTGFDFHVGADGPKLIEINTNAGGAMLNAAAEWRHPDCCDASNPAVRAPVSRAHLEAAFVAMFRNEWRLARGERPLRTIAIVDDQPAQQFLYPEFRLFQQLFAAQGIEAQIVDAASLEFSKGCLRAGDLDIDLVYNRVTDFYLEETAHQALLEAYVSDAALITPHPRAYALLADKRNLARFTDADFLRSVGVQEGDVDVLLAGIPQTRLVDGDPQAWWQDRKAWFFKPTSGFGSPSKESATHTLRSVSPSAARSARM